MLLSAYQSVKNNLETYNNKFSYRQRLVLSKYLMALKKYESIFMGLDYDVRDRVNNELVLVISFMMVENILCKLQLGVVGNGLNNEFSLISKETSRVDSLSTKLSKDLNDFDSYMNRDKAHDLLISYGCDEKTVLVMLEQLFPYEVPKENHLNCKVIDFNEAKRKLNR